MKDCLQSSRMNDVSTVLAKDCAKNADSLHSIDIYLYLSLSLFDYGPSTSGLLFTCEIALALVSTPSPRCGACFQDHLYLNRVDSAIHHGQPSDHQYAFQLGSDAGKLSNVHYSVWTVASRLIDSRDTHARSAWATS